MPELPDVELYRRRIDAAALQRDIADVEVLDARILDGVAPDRFRRVLRGNRLEATRRHGKHLLVRLARDGWLTLHFGMSGEAVAYGADDPAPRFTRIRFDFAAGAHLAYISRRMLGRVGLADDAESFIAAHGLGPDALDPGFDAAALHRLLSGRRKDVKAVLMDQGALAGIGNIFADEILFQARLHPRTPAQNIDQPKARRLHQTMREVLEKAIERGAGSEQFVERLPATWLLPHRRKDAPCPAGCGGTVATLKSGGRTTYFCPSCQRA